MVAQHRAPGAGGHLLKALALLLALGAGQVSAGPLLQTVSFRGAQFDVVVLPLSEWKVRVDWAAGGQRLREVGGQVRTNAGIFEPGFVPSGLLVSEGRTLHPLGCPDALYLDGVISALWAPDAGREADLDKGPFAGVITATPR